MLRPEDAENYYRLRDLVPADLWPGLGQARIAITNFHGFLTRERGMGKGASSLTKAVLSRGGRSPFLETPDQVAARVLADLGGGSSEVVVFNDEAHHCYRGRAAPEEGAATEQALTGEERADAKERNAEARVWFTGLSAVHRRAGLKIAYDLSATPFFLSGSGYREGTLFPWVVSDFSLIDAIESGLVKIPRVPVDDDRVASRVTYLNLWHEVRDHLPRKSRRDVDLIGPPNPPAALEGALQSLYGSYAKAFEAWQASDAAARGETPPVFIVVCNNTTVSKIVFDWVAGWERNGDGASALVPVRLGLFSNVVEGEWTPRPRTILVDSAQLESGETMSSDFKAIARTEIDEFKEDYRRRFPGRSADDITDEDLLREVLNSVGKQGRLGEHVRCVVSVSMLTEGWDANTVTHILGVRAFGTQLLCEQVVGRGLRRRSYAVDPDTGCFTPEYADVYGVPFQFIPTVAPTKDLTAKPTRRVHSDPDRAAAEITFPRLAGYRVELPDASLFADLDDAEPFVVTKDTLPTYTLVTGVVGRSDVHELDELRDVREQTVAYEIARVLVERHLSTAEDPTPWYFPQAVRIIRDWMRTCVKYHDDTFPGLLLLSENTHHAAERVWDEVIRQVDDREPHVLPMMRPYDAMGSTAEVDFFTTREVYPTSEQRCHVSYVVLDGVDGNAWERTVAQALEALPGVAAYVKNDHLGFTIPYTHKGRTHQFVPDFLVRLSDTGVGVARTIVVEVSGGRKDQSMRAAKAETTRDLWLPAVNNDGRCGRWGFCEVDDPTRAKLDIGAAADALRKGLG